MTKVKIVFWRTINNRVLGGEPLPPMKLFRNVLQDVFRKTEGDGGGALQFRALMRSHTSNLKWESKLVTQTIKY